MPVVHGKFFDDLGRNSDCGDKLGQITNDRGTRTYRCPSANRDLLNDIASDAKHAAFTDQNVAGQMNTGIDGGVTAKSSVMTDDRARIDDSMIIDHNSS